MQKFILSLIFLSTSFLLQAQAYEDKIEFNKKNQDCLVMDFNYPAAAVENGLVSKMNKLGYKGKEEKGIFNKDKGFRVYIEALVSEISDIRYDYVINIERKSRKESNDAVLYFLIQKDGNNALAKLNTQELKNAKTFLYELLPYIEAANLELKITNQEEIVNKAEKKLMILQTDKEDMEKRVKKLQDDLKQNEKDQESQLAEIENQKKTLEELRTKRKN